jgi:hypothetical protein
MWSLWVDADGVLRSRPWVVTGAPAAKRTLRLAGVLVVFGLLYGAVMGTFGVMGGERLLQVVYSAVKVPILLTGTFALSLPSFFVLNTVAGVRSDFSYVLRALVATQAGLTVVLASLAPLTVLWYVSFDNYTQAILFNAVMFGMASVLAQRLLRRYYRPLIARNRRHLWLYRAWLVVYAFVGIQMAWLLRPFIGDPNSAVTFFRHGAWGNAYEVLAQIIARLARP